MSKKRDKERAMIRNLMIRADINIRKLSAAKHCKVIDEVTKFFSKH